MKNLFRYVFAAALATTVYFYSQAKESSNTKSQEDQYELVSSHPDAPRTGPLSEIQPLCQGQADVDCAFQVDNPTNIIKWEGSTSKF